MFNQDDLDALTNGTGMSEMEVMAHETLGAEYILRQRMFHAMGEQGPLPRTMLVDLLRFLDFQPPVRKAPLKAMEIRWDDIRIGARVLVSPDDKQPLKQFYGTFKGKPEPGYLSVLLDGAVGGWVDEFPMRMVTLAPADAPSFVAPEELLLDSLKPAPEPPPVVVFSEDDDLRASNTASDDEEDALPFDEVESVQVPGTVDRADPEGRVKAPVMAKDWSEVDPGAHVMFVDGEDLLDAEFIEDGPADGHVSISVNGKTKMVPEELVEA